jgi:hypothetical protein
VAGKIVTDVDVSCIQGSEGFPWSMFLPAITSNTSQ